MIVILGCGDEFLRDVALMRHAFGAELEACTQIVGLVVVAVLTAAFVFLRYRALLFSTFDPDVATVSGARGDARCEARCSED